MGDPRCYGTYRGKLFGVKKLVLQILFLLRSLFSFGDVLRDTQQKFGHPFGSLDADLLGMKPSLTVSRHDGFFRDIENTRIGVDYLSILRHEMGGLFGGEKVQVVFTQQPLAVIAK